MCRINVRTDSGIGTNVLALPVATPLPVAASIEQFPKLPRVKLDPAEELDPRCLDKQQRRTPCCGAVAVLV